MIRQKPNQLRFAVEVCVIEFITMTRTSGIVFIMINNLLAQQVDKLGGKEICPLFCRGLLNFVTCECCLKCLPAPGNIGF